MVGDILQPTHLLFVLVVALLVLGPKRLPEVGRSLGKTMRDFRSALSGEEFHQAMVDTTQTSPASPPIAPMPMADATATVESTTPADLTTAPAPAETSTPAVEAEDPDAMAEHTSEPATTEHQPTAAP
jgi:sec-independent protein translocase protein TatA